MLFVPCLMLKSFKLQNNKSTRAQQTHTSRPCTNVRRIPYKLNIIFIKACSNLLPPPTVLFRREKEAEENINIQFIYIAAFVVFPHDWHLPKSLSIKDKHADGRTDWWVGKKVLGEPTLSLIHQRMWKIKRLCFPIKSQHIHFVWGGVGVCSKTYSNIILNSSIFRHQYNAINFIQSS